MKNGMKLLALGAAFAGAAFGLAAYRKYKDTYEQLPEKETLVACDTEDENDFVTVIEEEDDFTYYVEDIDQIMFHE